MTAGGPGKAKLTPEEGGGSGTRGFLPGRGGSIGGPLEAMIQVDPQQIDVLFKLRHRGWETVRRGIYDG